MIQCTCGFSIAGTILPDLQLKRHQNAEFCIPSEDFNIVSYFSLGVIHSSHELQGQQPSSNPLKPHFDL